MLVGMAVTVMVQSSSITTSLLVPLGAAGLLMALGAAALLVQGDTLLAGSAAGVVATVLVAGAVVLSRAQAEPEAAVAVAWASTAYAAVASRSADCLKAMLIP